jgi:hypothetical protein
MADYQALSNGVRPSEFQEIMSYWGKRARGTGSTIEGLKPTEEIAIAKKVFSALKEDLSIAAETAGAKRNAQGQFTSEGAAALKKATDIYRQHSEAMDKAITAPVKKVLKLADSDSFEAIPEQMIKLGNRELEGVLRMVDKTDRSVGQDLRAQYLKKLAESSGGSTGKKLNVTASSNVMSMKKFDSVIDEHQDKLVTMYGGDKKAIQVIENYKEAAARLSSGPGWAGSDTFPKAMEFIATKFGGMSEMIRSIASDSGKFGDEGALKLMSSADGMEWVTKLYKEIDRVQRNPSASKLAKESILRILPHIANLSIVDEFTPEKTPQGAQDGTPTGP